MPCENSTTNENYQKSATGKSVEGSWNKKALLLEMKKATFKFDMD